MRHMHLELDTDPFHQYPVHSFLLRLEQLITCTVCGRQATEIRNQFGIDLTFGSIEKQEHADSILNYFYRSTIRKCDSKQCYGDLSKHIIQSKILKCPEVLVVLMATVQGDNFVDQTGSELIDLEALEAFGVQLPSVRAETICREPQYKMNMLWKNNDFGRWQKELTGWQAPVAAIENGKAFRPALKFDVASALADIEQERTKYELYALIDKDLAIKRTNDDADYTMSCVHSERNRN